MAQFGDNPLAPGTTQTAPKFGANKVVQGVLPTISLIDTTDESSGAPSIVRHAVGGAPQRDRLATIQGFYPDAQPYGKDNFIFTDPKSGRPTLYNPPGLDLGDVSSLTPEIAEMTGGVVGGALATPGAVAGAPFSGGLSLLGIPFGVGLGAAGGRELENIAATNLIGRVDTRGLGEHLADTALTTGVNAVGQRATDLAIRGGRALVGAASRRLFTRSTPQELATSYANQGVTPMAGAVSGSRPVQIAEHALSYTPGGSAVMQQAGERVVRQTGEAVNAMAGRVGSQQSPQVVGGMLRQGAEEAGARFAARREALDANVEHFVGADNPVPVTNIVRTLANLRGELARAPQSRAADLGRAITELQQIVADAGQGGQLSFGQLRRIRTRIGRELDRPDISGYRPGEDAQMARVYGALAQDIQAAARSAGPDAERALALHDRYVRFNRSMTLPVLDEMVGKSRPDEYIFKWALDQSMAGGTRLMKLRNNLRVPGRAGPDESTWDELVSATLTRMGQARPGQQGMPVELLGQADTFSPSTFLTNFAKMSPQAKQALFGGNRYAGLRTDLEDIVRITSSMKDAERMANFSGTGRALLYGALGLSAGQAMVGNIASGAGTVAGTVVAPYIAARLITNPRFAHWLVQGQMIGTSPASFTRHLGRLAGIAGAEPDLRDAIAQYYSAIRAAPAPTQPAPAR